MKQRKNQRKFKAAFFRLLQYFIGLKGRNSLRSNSLPFLTPDEIPAFDAGKTRPENLSACSLYRCFWHVFTFCIISHLYSSPFCISFYLAYLFILHRFPIYISSRSPTFRILFFSFPFFYLYSLIRRMVSDLLFSPLSEGP